MMLFFSNYEQAFGKEGFFGENDDYQNEDSLERRETNKKIYKYYQNSFQGNKNLLVERC